MIVKTEAIVLKAMKYGETSKIVTLFSKEYGRISVIAKGARSRSNKFGSSLDSLSHVQAVLYRKEGRELHLLSQCDTLSRFPRLAEDLSRLGPALAVLELMLAVSHADEECSDLFSEVLETLAAMNGPEANLPALLLHFQMKLLGILGFRPDLVACTECRETFENRPAETNFGHFRLHSDGLICPRCAAERKGHTAVKPDVLGFLRTIQQGDAARIARGGTVPPGVLEDAQQVVWYYLQSHIDGLRSLKAGKVFAAVG